MRSRCSSALGQRSDSGARLTEVLAHLKLSRDLNALTIRPT